VSVLRNLGQVFGAGKGPWGRRFLIWLVAGVIGATIVIIAAYYFDVYTESDKFCGLVCHANRPQYIASEVSAHANVECGICHIGPGLFPKLSSKIYGVGELYKQLTNTYERPIAPPVARLRSARDICQQCHWPAVLHRDQSRLFSYYATDEENSVTRVFLILRLGQGGDLGGSAQGIHWHIGNLSYIALDPQNQDIPWVGVQRSGQLEEYLATGSSLTAEQLERLPRQQMSCLDCHNRAAHTFRKPERGLDEALAAERIDRSLPFVKREALQLLSASYPTKEAGLKAMEELETFYRSQYPELYADKKQVVEQATSAIQDVYRYSTLGVLSEQSGARGFSRVLPLPRWRALERARKSYSTQL
jgi:nitrate/TMAO reductase-like tetraheme cytochrome c subunit